MNNSKCARSILNKSIALKSLVRSMLRDVEQVDHDCLKNSGSETFDSIDICLGNIDLQIRLHQLNFDELREF